MIGEINTSEINISEINVSEATANSRFDVFSELKLESDTVDLWLVPLGGAPTAKLESVLSNDERARAERFRFEPDKKHFIAARAFLRIILGKYLKINPLCIRFEYNKYGKPAIGGDEKREIKFNLSHSGHMALFALTKKREVGVDIERVKTSFADEATASECLTQGEIERFRILSGSERDKFFFDCWTRKEAFIKACGKGLLLPAKQIEAFPKSGFVTYPASNVSESPHNLWSLQQLPVISGYAAALAIEGAKPGLIWRRQTV